MNIRVFTSIFGIFIFLANAASQDSDEQIRAAHLGIVFPLSTNGVDAPSIKNRFSLHLIGGISAGELGICLSGFGHINIGGLSGIQLSGFGNVVGAASNGVMMAGFGNVSTDMKGIQGAGFGNVSSRVEGVQLGGFGNVSSQMQGIQLSGFGNIAGNMKGIQGAGFLNVSEQLKGIQLAGFMNIADKVDGIQVAGFINIADSSNYPIGIINIVRQGEMYLQASVDELGSSILDFRSGGRYTYGFIGAGINSWLHNRVLPASHAGIGIKFPVGRIAALRLEVLSSNIQSSRQNEGLNKNTIRALIDFNPGGGRLHLYAGASLSAGWTRGEFPDTPLILREWSGSRNGFLLAGFNAGLAFRIKG